MANEAYCKRPHCEGEVMIVLKGNGRLVSLRHSEEAQDRE